jgi:NADH-quinone oxidoreductase subunit A
MLCTLPLAAAAGANSAMTGANPGAMAPVVWLIIIALGFTVSNLALSLLIGPSRTGDVKSSTYESGMTPIGDARKRFNVRFYIVAMIFLVFDVDIIFFYPWATIFSPSIQSGGASMAGLLVVEMAIFVGILLLAYFYAWGKGVFRWD